MKAKRILSVMLSSLIIISAFVLPVQATEVDNIIIGASAVTISGDTYGDYEYNNLSNGRIVINKYNGKAVNVVMELSIILDTFISNKFHAARFNPS